MIALALISIVAAIAIPVHFSRGDVTLENACVLMARDLRAAQNRSAYLGVASTFFFPADGTGYQVSDARGSLVRNPRTDQPFTRDYTRDAVFEGVSVLEVRFGPDRSLQFDEQGLASESGEVVLAYRGETRILSIRELSGEVTIIGSTSGWHDDGY